MPFQVALVGVRPFNSFTSQGRRVSFHSLWVLGWPCWVSQSRLNTAPLRMSASVMASDTGMVSLMYPPDKKVFGAAMALWVAMKSSRGMQSPSVKTR